MYRIINEEDIDICDRQLLLIAWFNNEFATDNLLPEIETSIEKYKNNIPKNNDYENGVNFYQKIKYRENCLYCYHLQAYADIILPKKYEVIGLYNKDPNIQKETAVFCKIEILSSFNKLRLFPREKTEHGHSDFCFINFPDGIPDIVYELLEIKEKKQISYNKMLFLCSRETYDLM